MPLNEGDAQPHNLATPRRVSAPLMKSLKEELQRMDTNDIITRVTAPNEWCSPIVVALKCNGKIRVCINYKKLNKSVMREQFIMPTIDEISARMAGSKVFSHLDCSMYKGSERTFHLTGELYHSKARPLSETVSSALIAETQLKLECGV